MTSVDPRATLEVGARVLGDVLEPAGFRFVIAQSGRGSGGHFARGDFIRADRRLELHFRRFLGLVRYHIGADHAGHEAYMRALGVWDRCAYPGFSSEPLVGFEHLAADLRHFGDDFIVGGGTVLRRAAAVEREATTIANKAQMTDSVGDSKRRAEARDAFRQGMHGRVVELFQSLQYPERLSQAERKMLDLARRRLGNDK